ncbi:MAG: hypothetical protein K9M80_04355 [Candidatus Marinimicrobia bacterium]|nr:hypothetical protein [Candidatus Neomarinimicrobiota bacterium]
MIFFWALIYNIVFIPVAYVGYYLAFLFNDKIRKGVYGRRQTNRELKLYREKHPNNKTILVHSASLGEFEQAKPVIRGLKALRPDIDIIASFASPSGFENADRLDEVSLFIYLPIDTLVRTDRFLTTLKPEKIIFVTYELWPNMIINALRYNISTYLMSARIRKDSLKWLPIIRTFFSEIYRCLDHIYAVSEEDSKSMKNLVGSVDVKVLNLGDTRYDQVVQRAEKNINGKVPQIYDEGFVFVGGSIWPQDVEKLLPALIKIMREEKQFKVILAPHEPSQYALEMLETRFIRAGYKTKRLSNLKEGPADERVILVDKVGVLAEIYHYCDAAFVGGSFRKSIHNVMEPAVAGIPVFFGPIYHNSREAESLIEKGGAKSHEETEGFYKSIKEIINNPAEYKKMAESARGVIIENLGASAKTVKEILEL